MADFYQLHLLQGVSVIALELPETIDALEFDQINESVLDLFEGKSNQPWVLDLSTVTYMGSAMLGLIVNVRQRVKSGGGQLIVCGLSGRLQEIFHTSSMERLFTIVKTRADAVRTMGT